MLKADTSHAKISKADGAVIATELLSLRKELPRGERAALDKMLGGILAAGKYSAKLEKYDGDARSFSEALDRAAKSLSPEQRSGMEGLLAVGAFAWGLDSDPGGDQQPDAVYFWHWVHLARTLAVLVTGAVVVIEEAIEDDPEPLVPVIDFPPPEFP